MKRNVVTLASAAVILSAILTLAPVKPVYAETKIFGFDLSANYLILKQKVMERVFGFNFPQSPVKLEGGQVNRLENVTPRPTNPEAFAVYTFTQEQVNDLIKSQVVGRNLGNGVTIKTGRVEFLDNNVIKLTAELTNSVKADATLKVIANGTALKIEKLDIENAGPGAKMLKPLVVRYFEGQQQALIKRYAPADFASVEIQAGKAIVSFNRNPLPTE